MEGAARFLSAEGGLADQVRADRRAVPARRADRSRAAAATSRSELPRCRASWRSAICRWPRTTATASSTRSRFSMRLDEHVAVIGQSGSGKNELALLLARLMRPTGGRITIGGHDLARAAAGRGRPPHRLCRRDARTCSPARCATICCSGCATGRCAPAEYDDEADARRRARQAEEARRSGNIDFDLHADWVDYDAAGVDERRGIVGAHRRGAGAARFRDRRLQFRPALAVRSGAAPGADRAAARGAARAARPPRRRRHHQAGRDLSTRSATTPTPASPKTCCSARRSARSSISRRWPTTLMCCAVLDKVGLTEDLIEAGRQVAATMIEMFADLPPDHEFFEQFSFISAERPAGIRRHPQRDRQRRRRRRCARSSAQKLLSLPFRLIAARHRLDVLDERDAAAPPRSAARLPPRPAGGGAAGRSSSSIPSATTPRPRCRTTFCSARSPTARPMRRCGCRR